MRWCLRCVFIIIITTFLETGSVKILVKTFLWSFKLGYKDGAEFCSGASCAAVKLTYTNKRAKLSYQSDTAVANQQQEVELHCCVRQHDVIQAQFDF